MATLDWSQCAAVESVPGKRSGAWVFRDARTPVSVVFENLEAGATIGNNAVPLPNILAKKLCYAQNSMTHEDVARLELVESDIRDLTTGKIARYIVRGFRHT